MLSSLVFSASSMNDSSGTMDKMNGGDVSMPNDNSEKSSMGIQDTDKNSGQDIEDMSSMEPDENQEALAMNMQ
jgi:hypothetical protein